MKRVAPIFFVIFLLFSKAFAQNNNDKIFRADNYFKIGNYEQALKLYQEVIDAGEKDAMIHFRTGECMFHSNDIRQRLKAAPLFEYALNKDAANLPAIVYYHLGEVQYLNEEIDMAVENFRRYKEKVKADKKALARVNRSLEVSNNALTYLGQPKKTKISTFGSTINSPYTEYNPVVAADESVMAFTALRPNQGKRRTGDDFIEQIYISYNSSGSWSQPIIVNVNADYNIGTAGISPDGQKMLIFIGGADNTGDLFEIQKSGDTWSKPKTLGPKVNSKYLETTASITPDGKTLYFASNRPGGYGGMDIYRSRLNAQGLWGNPENLGKDINSRYNEDAPFIHPDQKTLFFTSNGHTTMGGKDIFKSVLMDGKWSQPQNLGYPINTTADDDYFTLTADGKVGYFSSNRKGGTGGQDIYFFDMPEEDANIALTMIKGKILDGESGKPMPTKIYLIDNETNNTLDFVYHPDPETGNYLVILPPAKNYDMVIESDGYLPYTLNINVPNQTYFYELYQKITLKTIKQFDVVVGQEVEVKNAFYDTHKDRVHALRKTHEAKLIQSDSIDVYDMMIDLMDASDQEGINYLLDLLYVKNPIEDVEFDESNPDLEMAKRTYYYDESDESKFEKKNVDGNTILSLPTFLVTEEAQKRMEKKVVNSNYDKTVLDQVLKVYFDLAKSELKQEYTDPLSKILDLLNRHQELGVQISGFASAEGDEDYNRKLSNERAIEVLNFFNHKGVVRRRIVARGYGATKAENISKEEGRRVDIKIVDLNDLGRI